MANGKWQMATAQFSQQAPANSLERIFASRGQLFRRIRLLISKHCD
jgi:hypothetical protein